MLDRDIRVRYGLDLSGGSQVLLEAADCTGSDIATRLENARQIIEKRVNALGVSEPLVQIQGDCRILIELPRAYPFQRDWLRVAGVLNPHT